MTAKNVDVEYAFWNVPGSSFTVTYSLGVFHEIDFVVNEGYRRIPHGGIEAGGLLFGQRTENSARIEGFRTIECEHESGPSFVLSERDLDRLRKQLVSAASDPELEGVIPLGWFIARTRSQMQLGDREAKIFDELFPSPGNITLLIKPERFQPTRFAFLVRDAESGIERDVVQQAIILPLQGRSTRANEVPIPSISAPAARPSPPPIVAAESNSFSASPVEIAPRAEIAPLDRRSAEPTPLQSEPAAAPKPETVVALELETKATGHTEAVTSQPVTEIQPEIRPETPRISPPSTAVPELEPEPAASEPESQPDNKLATIPGARAWPSIDEIKKRRSEKGLGVEAADTRAAHQQITQKMNREGRRSNTRSALIVFLAAALGSGVGYWAYLRLPPATVPLTAHPNPTALTISWPSDQTRDSGHAAIRIDDGEPVSLSNEDKAAGQTEIKTTGDNVKVELIVEHWMRDSRGIVRFVMPLKPPLAAVPSSEPPKRGSRRHSRPSQE